MHRFVGIIVLVLAIESSIANAQVVDTAKVVSDTGEFHMTKSPLEAVLLSAVVPGAGQVYLGQAWKLPILYGLAGGFLYGALIQNSRYHQMQDSINYRNGLHTALDSAIANQFVSVREFYRDDRDKWWIYLGITYIANLLDAYIAANLYDFDVSNPGESPIQSYYDPISKRIEVHYTLRF